MRGNRKILRLLAAYLAILTPFIVSGVAYAEDVQGVNAVQSFIEAGIKILSLLIGSVAVFFVVVGGWRYVTSSNNPDKLESAKGTLIHAGVGLAIVIGANVLVGIVKEVATSAFGK